MDNTELNLNGAPPAKHAGLKLPPLPIEVEMQPVPTQDNTISLPSVGINESPNSPPDPAEPSCFSKFIAYINTEEYWPLWVGLLWYVVVLGYTFWGL